MARNKPVRCPHNRRMYCWIARIPKRYYNCPALDGKWMDIITRWAITGRAPGALDFDIIRGTRLSFDDAMVHKCNIHQVLDDALSVLAWCNNERFMSVKMCKDLIKGQMIFKGLLRKKGRPQEIKRIRNNYSELFE